LLTLYRRHLAVCQHKAKGRTFKRCKCPIWIQGTTEGKPVRKSLDVTSWERAEEIKSDIEHGKEEEKEVTVEAALAAFVQDCESRNLNRSTLGKYRRLSGSLSAFLVSRGIDDVAEITPETLRVYRNSSKLGPRTASKEIERIRSLFRFCQESGWIAANPAKAIKAPQVRPNPTLPFTDGEIAGILANSDFRSQVFFRVLLHSGLRIIDAASLRPERITDGKLFLYAQKTGHPVWVPLPPDLISDLSKIPLTGGFYFVVESENPVSVAERYRVRLKNAAKKAGVKHAHPHRFRDSFACRLLVNGVSIENVAILLSNTVRVCERHYAPWIKARQDALELAVQSTWDRSPKLVRVK
jgi:site-specific recombinase XerD